MEDYASKAQEELAKMSSGQHRKRETVMFGDLELEAIELAFGTRNEILQKGAALVESKLARNRLKSDGIDPDTYANMLLVVECLVEPGTMRPVFSDKNIRQLLEIGSETIQNLIRAVFRVNGLRRGEEVEEVDPSVEELVNAATKKEVDPTQG